MSINHFSQDLPDSLKWSHHPHPSSWNSSQFFHPSPNFPLTDAKDQIALNSDLQFHKEPMFEKPLTPSDVGKLNRLVIPKQHAEKYFPLGNSESPTDKGFLLSFEDEVGKFWRFRYSYWNSSQSYVLTKGWSRYVKEKRLDAGDVVLFERHRIESDRIFIGCRRRTTAPQDEVAQQQSSSSGGCSGGGGGGWTREFYSAHPYPAHHGHGHPMPYQPDCIHAGSANVESRTTQSGNSKTVRLFGVNLECLLDESEPSTSDGSPPSDPPNTLQFHLSHCDEQGP